MTDTSDDTENKEGYLAGQLLLAMPQMLDERFTKSVIYMCAHTEDGAMGLVVNKVMENIDFPDLLDQLGLSPSPTGDDIRVHFGGPVESGRGFVLHTQDYMHEGSLAVDDTIALTATVDILRAIAEGSGPEQRMLALGYAGWGPGQLDAEIRANGWLHVESDRSLLFDVDLDEKWELAMGKIGIDPRMLSDSAAPSSADRPARTPDSEDQAHRQRYRQPGPDCPRRRSRPGIPAESSPDHATHLQQTASSKPH